jgi:pimeloyl-ACP methyl ester carboxylesterase
MCSPGPAVILPEMTRAAILLPGVVLPKDLAYGALIDSLDDDLAAHPKDLEVYETDEPPVGYGLEIEVAGVLREADAAGLERFHLVGYSGGGAISTAVVAGHPDRVLSLALLEPAWIGNEGLSSEERATWDELERIRELPPEEMMPRFVAAALAPGVEPPPPPPGPMPPWMAKRPAGIRALTDAFQRYRLDQSALRAFDRPVYFALGALSNPDYYGRMAERAGELFEDFTLDVYEGRHHFDPPHRAEPERLASRLEEVWSRAVEGDGA